MNYNIPDWAILMLSTMFGAVANSASEYKDQKLLGNILYFIDFLISFIISCFSGFIFGLVATMRTGSTITIILASAIGAFMGDKGLKKISITILETITTKLKGKL